MAGKFDLTTVTADVVGVGIRAPFQFSVGKGVRSVASTGGTDKIIASMKDILLTRPGERVMSPDFGSRLFDLVFEPLDEATNTLLYHYTVEALNRWERRIQITSVDFAEDPNDESRVTIMISFVVRATHERGSFVFPYERRTIPMEQAVTGAESLRIFSPGSVLPLSNPSFSNVGTTGG